MGHNNSQCSLLLKHNKLLTQGLALALGAPKLEFSRQDPKIPIKSLGFSAPSVSIGASGMGNPKNSHGIMGAQVS